MPGHVDLHGDGGGQIAILRRKIEEFGAAVRHNRMSKRVAAYLVWHTVLIPRIMFPLSVLRINLIDIENLESRALRHILPKLGMYGKAARHLIGADRTAGDLGCIRWSTLVTMSKARLAMELAEHPDPYLAKGGMERDEVPTMDTRRGTKNMAGTGARRRTAAAHGALVVGEL